MSDSPQHQPEEIVELIRSIDVGAPASLHARIDELVAGATPGRRPKRRLPRPLLAGATALAALVAGATPGRRPKRRLPRPLLAGATALATLVVALVLTLGGGGGPAPIVQDAAALTLRPATAPPPAESHARRGQLAAAVEGVAFPYWEESLGWRSNGTREDRIDGRPVMTVFYVDARGQRLGYAIAGGGDGWGSVLRESGGSVHWRHGTAYRLLRLHGAQTVVWLRSGRLCVLSGRGVPAATLLRLAGWGDGATPA